MPRLPCERIREERLNLTGTWVPVAVSISLWPLLRKRNGKQTHLAGRHSSGLHGGGPSSPYALLGLGSRWAIRTDSRHFQCSVSSGAVEYQEVRPFCSTFRFRVDTFRIGSRRGWTKIRAVDLIRVDSSLLWLELGNTRIPVEPSHCLNTLTSKIPLLSLE